MPIILGPGPSAFTCQEVIDRARRMIHDTAKRRVSDDTYFQFLKDFLLWLYNVRPDWFIGQYTGIPTLSIVSAAWPLEDRTIPMAELYLTARAEYPDDQNVAQERVAQSFKLLEVAVHG